MAHEIVPVVLFLVLGLTVLPVACLRRALLGLLHFGLHLAIFGAVCGCVFFYYRPDLAPASLSHSLEPIAAWFDAQLAGTLPKEPGYVFLALAATLVLAGWPALTALDLARRFLKHTVLWDRLLRDAIRAGATDKAPGKGSAAGTSDTGPRPRLLRDLMNG